MIRVKSIMIINCNNKNINKNYSPSGNWTRAFRVRAEYPSQLDQWGVDTSLSRYSFLFRSSNFLFTEFSSHHDSILRSEGSNDTNALSKNLLKRVASEKPYFTRFQLYKPSHFLDTWGNIDSNEIIQKALFCLHRDQHRSSLEFKSGWSSLTL